MPEPTAQTVTVRGGTRIWRRHFYVAVVLLVWGIALLLAHRTPAAMAVGLGLLVLGLGTLRRGRTVRSRA